MGQDRSKADVNQPCTTDVTWETLIYCIQSGGFRGERGGKHAHEKIKLKVSVAVLMRNCC